MEPYAGIAGMKTLNRNILAAISAFWLLVSCPVESRGDAFSTPEGQLTRAALSQIGQTLLYDPGYVKLAYPGGDVPLERGTCTDVIVRAFRSAGVDLQVEVHRDMAGNFSSYPKTWGLKAPDANIDHRRVPNLMTFFKRKGKSLPVSAQPEDYLPGDVVAFRLPNGLHHIGLVVDRKSADGIRPMLVHNIGYGAQLEDILFAYERLGHYRYFDSFAPGGG